MVAHRTRGEDKAHANGVDNVYAQERLERGITGRHGWIVGGVDVEVLETAFLLLQKARREMVP